MRAARALLVGLLVLATYALVPPTDNRFGLWRPTAYASIGILRASQTAFETVTPNMRTFAQHLRVQLREQPALAELQPVLCAIAAACRDVSRLTRSNAISGSSESRSVTVNVQGEMQSEMDVEANRLLKTALCSSGHVAIVASEEDAIPSRCNGGRGEFAAVIDPLDGSANVAVGLPTGTIFGVYRRPLGPPVSMKRGVDSGADETTLLQCGSELVAAGYCLYSAVTQLVVTVRGHGAHLFTLDDVTGDFFAAGPPLRLPTDGPLFCFNEAYSPRWEPAVAAFARDLKHQALGASLSPTAGRPESPRKVSARYVGALVADVHNILRHGGIFGYPATCQMDGTVSCGKLRLVYEANPLAMVVQAAGGAASDGRGAILHRTVREIHERTPLFIGSASLVAAVEDYVRHFAAR